MGPYRGHLVLKVRTNTPMTNAVYRGKDMNLHKDSKPKASHLKPYLLTCLLTYTHTHTAPAPLSFSISLALPALGGFDRLGVLAPLSRNQET